MVLGEALDVVRVNGDHGDAFGPILRHQIDEIVQNVFHKRAMVAHEDHQQSRRFSVILRGNYMTIGVGQTEIRRYGS